jgi:hypothetical protein
MQQLLLVSMLHCMVSRGDLVMRYELLLLLTVLAILLIAGLALIVDGVRRVIRELRESNRDLPA